MMLDKKQRENLAKIVSDIGKLTFGAIVIGKFVSPTPVSDLVFWVGMLFSI